MRTFWWSLSLPSTREFEEDGSELEGSDIPLLNRHDIEAAPPSEWRRTTSRPLWVLALCVLGGWALGFLMGGVGSTMFVHKADAELPPNSSSSPKSDSDPNSESVLRATAVASVDALFARQSATLSQARARYVLRNNRPPPPSFSKWFAYAHERKCLIDEYDQVYADFKVFYDIAQEDRGYFRRMAEKAARQTENRDAWIVNTTVTKGSPSFTGHTAYDGYWPVTFPRFTKIFGDMSFLVSGRDEPRVAFNPRSPEAWQRLRDFTSGKTPGSAESKAFSLEPSPSAGWFAEQGCVVPLENEGMFRSANNRSGFILATVNPAFTTELYPILSMAKVSACFADILFPTEFYYSYSWWYQPFAYQDRVKWGDKLNKAYWRGGATNGRFLDNSTYHSFPRFILADLSTAHPELLDAKITTFPGSVDRHCHADCDSAPIIKEYGIAGQRTPREDVYKYKYVVDVDGATFSGRFWGLLLSGSLVFKSTIFNEFFNNWVRPYEHYVPVLPDLSDLVERIEWANAHPEEARLIQLRGLEVARRVLSDTQNDCYWANVLMHWEELMAMGAGEQP